MDRSLIKKMSILLFKLNFALSFRVMKVFLSLVWGFETSNLLQFDLLGSNKIINQITDLFIKPFRNLQFV